jgi:hypothetical protein
MFTHSSEQPLLRLHNEIRLSRKIRIEAWEKPGDPRAPMQLEKILERLRGLGVGSRNDCMIAPVPLFHFHYLVVLRLVYMPIS